MLNKLSFNIFNELNESESKKYKVKKRVLIESDGIKTIKENLGLVKIEFECNECGHNWIEDYEDYFSDEDELNEILENGDGSIDCPECGGNDIKWKDVNIIEENKSVCEKCGKEHCECDKTLNEKDSEKLGGDPEDFISDVQTILDTLNQIDTSSFGTKLAQQMIEDWVETCERQIQKGKRLASGDEFYSESSLTEDDNDIMRLVKKSIKNGKLPDEIKYKGKIYKSFYVMNSDNSGETSNIYYCNMENTPSGDPQESNDYFFVKVALNKTDRGYNGIKEIRFVEDLTEGCSKQKINEDEYGDNPIKTNDKYQLYKSMKGTDIDGVTYSSYLVRDNNGNGVRSFIAKNDIEASKKFNESSINEDSIEDAKNDSIKKGLYSESSTSLRERFKKFLDNNVKNKDYNFDAYIDDLTTQYGNTGTLEYELSKSESKSGKPELFNYSEEDLKELGYNLTESMPNDWYDEMFSKYVPKKGKSDTTGGEILRTFSFVSHMFLQNGDKIWRNNMKNNSHVLDPEADTLYDLLPQEGKDLMQTMANSTTYNAYKKRLDKLEDYIYNYLNNNKSLFESKEVIEEAEEMQVKNLQVIKEQGNVYMLEDENKKMIVGENYNAKEGIIENAEIYENKDEADKDYLNRCEILKGNEDYKDDLKEAKTVKEYRIIDTTDNKVLKTFKTEDKEKGYTEMRKMSKKLKDEGKKDNLIYKEYKVKK